MDVNMIIYFIKKMINISSVIVFIIIITKMFYCQHSCDPYFGNPSIPREFDYKYYSDSENSEDEQEEKVEVPTTEIFKLFNADGGNVDMKKYKNLDGVGHSLLCGFLVVPGSTKCIFHKCRKDGCDNSKRYKYCKEHKCRWRYCEELVCDNSKYCVKHKCQLCDTCVMYDYVQHCKKHLNGTKCMFNGCKGIVTTDEQSYCIYHKCKDCNNCIWQKGAYLCHQCIEKDPDWKQNGAEFRSFLSTSDKDHRYIMLCESGRKCAFNKCRRAKMEDDVELGDVIFSSKYCLMHHFLDEICENNYKFGLKHISFLDVVEDTDVVQDSPKIMIMKEIHKLAISLCK